MNRIAARIAVTVAVATVLFGTLATTAFASIYDSFTPLGWSSTNPGALEDKDIWWRGGWGTSTTPDYKLNNPSMEPDIQLISFKYLIDSQPATVISSQTAGCDTSFMLNGVHLGGTLDLNGRLENPPFTGAHALEPGATSPIEGHWYMHYIFHDNADRWGPYVERFPLAPKTTWNAFFGVDRTPPAAVTGLAASPNDTAWPVGAVSPSSRVKLTWDLKQYDGLAGVAYYQVFIDGQPAIPEKSSAPAQGRVYELAQTWKEGQPPSNPAVVTNTVTIENAPAGTHTYSIACVDRATNQGPLATVTFTTDPDVPTLSWKTPAGSYIGLYQPLSVVASDTGGIKSVQYKLDGVAIGTSTAAPYSLTAYLGAFAAGTHTLSATITDAFGRTTTISKTVSLDKVMLKVTNYSRTPKIFYPIKRDGYKDNSYIYYRLNKSAKVTLTIRNSAGTIVRTLSTSTGAGSHKFVWNGKWASDGTAHTGRYYYKITAVDNTGRSVSTGTLTTWIRNYELKRISRSMVKVIPR